VTTVAIIGTGAEPDDPDRTGFAMAYSHADAYEAVADCEIVACADIVRENAAAFADAYDLPEGGVYTDHETMLDAVDPDVVSVCTPPAVHEDLVVDCIDHGVGAVHCEKPMADTWGASRRMAAAAADSETQLTFNHQRRFGRPFRRAKELLDAGAIGDLERIELAAGNLMDYASHSIDLAHYFADETDVAWVMGQFDYRDATEFFGVHNENQGIATWAYESGVHALAATGDEHGPGLVDCHHRLVGSDGEIEIGVGFPNTDDHGTHRVRRAGSGEWEPLDADGETVHGPDFVERAIRDVVESYREGRDCELRAENALRTTEVIFAAYESARRRGRIDLPLDIEDHPLEALIAAEGDGTE